MEDASQPYRRANRQFALAMLLLMLVSFAYLVYGSGFEHFFPSFGAMLAIPFAAGALFANASGGNSPFNMFGCIFAPLALFAVIFPLVYFGFAEGLICILMVLPFWLVAGLGGGLAAWLNARWQRHEALGEGEHVRAAAWALLPLVLVMLDEVAPAPWQERTVQRSVWVAATPEQVWPLLLTIPAIRQEEGRPTLTHDWLGVPRPSNAELVQTEAGLVRKAEWGSNIRFEEHVTQVTPGRGIAWRFVFPDGSVQAHTDRHIAPNGPILKIMHGGYSLQGVNGGTQVTLTTTYRMRTRLGWYLEWWGEQILGDVEVNVLTIIKDRAEGIRVHRGFAEMHD